MGITFVGAGTEGNGTGGTISPGLPSGLVSGDILICVAGARGTGITAVSMDSAWTKVVEATTSSRWMSVWWARRSSSDPPTTITYTDSGTGVKVAGIMAFRGVRTAGSPFDQVGSTTTGTGTSMPHAAITTSIGKNGCMILAVNASGSNDTQNQNRTLNSGWTNVFEDTSSGTQNCFVFDNAGARATVSTFYRAQSVPGTENLTVTKAQSGNWLSVHLALSPALFSDVGDGQALTETGGEANASIAHAASDSSLSFYGGDAVSSMNFSVLDGGAIIALTGVEALFKKRIRRLRKPRRKPVHPVYGARWPKHKGYFIQ